MEHRIEEQKSASEALEAFLGKWHTTGTIHGEDGNVTGRVDATDIYEWLPGHYAMIHYIDSDMGGTKVEGIEIIGYDPARQAYFVPFFDNQGAAGWEELRHDGGTWTWNGENVMGVGHHRCTARFRDRDTIDAVHEHSADGTKWHKWMEITLRKMR